MSMSHDYDTVLIRSAYRYKSAIKRANLYTAGDSWLLKKSKISRREDRCSIRTINEDPWDLSPDILRFLALFTIPFSDPYRLFLATTLLRTDFRQYDSSSWKKYGNII